MDVNGRTINYYVNPSTSYVLKRGVHYGATLVHP